MAYPMSAEFLDSTPAQVGACSRLRVLRYEWVACADSRIVVAAAGGPCGGIWCCVRSTTRNIRRVSRHGVACRDPARGVSAHRSLDRPIRLFQGHTSISGICDCR